MRRLILGCILVLLVGYLFVELAADDDLTKIKPVSAPSAYDRQRWVAEHGDPDLMAIDYFDRLAREVWHLPIGKGQFGWAHTDVDCLVYRKSRLIVFFVLAKSDGPGSDFGYDFLFYGCANSRTGRLLSADVGKCAERLNSPRVAGRAVCLFRFRLSISRHLAPPARKSFLRNDFRLLPL